MEPTTEMRDARPDERDALRDLHRRSSLVWDADRPHLMAHPEVFGVAGEAIAEGRVRVAVDAGEALLGFSVIGRVRAGVCELDDLFVDPDAMRRGIGRALVEDVVVRAASGGAREIAVTANPDAVGFYERVGFVRGDMVPTRFRPGIRMRRTVTTETTAADGSMS
jgi:GNAT superfamily N-acetyltransferase